MCIGHQYVYERFHTKTGEKVAQDDDDVEDSDAGA